MLILRPSTATIQPVLVVPRLAPNMTPTACGNVSSPALTNPMVVNVVALEDCTSMVTVAPDNSAENGPRTKRLSTRRKASPATALRPSVSKIMPKRKSPMPPNKFGIISWCHYIMKHQNFF